MKPQFVLILASALLLAACDPPAQPEVAALSGTAADGGLSRDADNNLVLETGPWTGGAGKVTVSAMNEGSVTALSSTALGSDGRFSFAALPTPAVNLLVPALSAVPVDGCTENVVVSDPKALGTAARLSVAADKSGTIAQIAVESVTRSEQASLPFYVDRDVNLKGQQTCVIPFGEISLDIDVQLLKGWNTVIVSQQTSGDATGLMVKGTIRKGSPGDAKWYLTGNAARPLGLNIPNLPTSPLFR